jgi:hypothetical protein
MDISLLTLAGGFLSVMVILVPLAVFADPVTAFGVGVVFWIGYSVIAYRAVTADQPADPNPRLPWEGLDAVFDDWWGDAKGLNMTVAALCIGTVLLFVMLLILAL